MTHPQPENAVPTESYTPPDNDNTAPGDVVDGHDRTLDRALDLVRFLRVRCEWDAAQTPHTLVPYLLEEAHETAEAITHGHDDELRGELGDLLLNVAFQIVLAEERRAFTAEDVVQTLESKMRRRHPHIYGEGERVAWETLKAQERAASSHPASLLHGIASGLEPLSKAQRIQDRVATVGFDWSDWRGAFEKVAEELEEVRELLHAPTRSEAALEEELGDLLFAVVNLTRLSGAHAMRALQRANGKFSTRFALLEQLATERGVVLGSASLEELDVLWDAVKASERERRA